MLILKQNTACKLPCLLYDKTDFITPEANIGHASISVWLRKYGGVLYPFDMNNGTAGKTSSFQSQAISGSTTTLVDSKLAGKYADDWFNGLLIRTISGSGSGQNLIVTDYTGSTGTFTFATATAVDSTTVYRVCKGVADSATANTLVDSILTEADDYWNGYQIQIIAGTGSGQVRTVSDFDAANDRITVSENWSVTPDNTSVYSLCNKWTEIGKGIYDISFSASELDALGSFVYQVTEGEANYLDYNGCVLIESNNLSGLETKIDTVDTNIDTIDGIVDTINTNVIALPTESEIRAGITTDHGSGAYTDSAGAGTYNVTIHCATSGAVDIPNAHVSVHNSSNDDEPLIASATTDTDGNADVNLDAGAYTIRAAKAGYTIANITPTIAGSGTQEMVGTGVTVPDPVAANMCRLKITPLYINGSNVSTLNIHIACSDGITVIDDSYIMHNSDKFTVDALQTPYQYWFDAVQGAEVVITCEELSIINRALIVPATDELIITTDYIS